MAEVPARHRLEVRARAEMTTGASEDKDARLIVMGSYREGKYTGAPLAHEIEVITANATCDVLIGVQGNRVKVLRETIGEKRGAAR